MENIDLVFSANSTLVQPLDTRLNFFSSNEFLFVIKVVKELALV